MKKILLSIILCSSLSCFAQDGSVSPEKDIAKLVIIGLEVAQDREVQEAVVQLHQAYLHLLEVTLQKIASKFGSEEKALAQTGLIYLAKLAKDPVLRSAFKGDLGAIDEKTTNYIVARVAPIIFVAQMYGPQLQKLVQEKVMVTKTRTHTDVNVDSITYVNTYPTSASFHFILDRIIEALELAQKSVQ